MVVWRVDLAHICAGRFPLPLKPFYRVSANLAAVAATALAGGIDAFYTFVAFRRVDPGSGDSKTVTRVCQGCIESVNGTITAVQSVFLLYVAVVYAIFAAYQIKHLGRRSAQRVIGAMEPLLVEEPGGLELGLLEMARTRSRGSSSRVSSPRTPPFALSPSFTRRSFAGEPPLVGNHAI